MKVKTIVIVMCVIMVGVSFGFVYPKLTALYGEFVGDLNQGTEKPPVIVEPEGPREEDTVESGQTYEEWYMRSLEGLTSEEQAHVERRRENFRFVYERDKDNQSGSAYMPVRGDTVLLTVKRAYFPKEELDLSGDMSWFLTGRADFPYDYEYLLLDIQIENTTDHDIPEVAMNGFCVIQANENLAFLQSEFLYSTYQPGKSTHVYFQPKLAPGEVIESTIVFYVPVDEQFQTYGFYLGMNQYGSSEFAPEMYGLLPFWPEKESM